MHSKAFLLLLVMAWERIAKKKKIKRRWRDGEIGKHKLNAMEAVNMK